MDGGILGFLVAVPFAALLVDLATVQAAPWRDPRHLLSGLRSGALLGSALFVLLAQGLNNRALHTEPDTVLSYLGLGFMATLLMDRSWKLFGLQRSSSGTAVLAAIPRSVGGAAIGAVSHVSLKSALLVAVTLLLQESLSAPCSLHPATRGVVLHRLAQAVAAALPLAAFLAITTLIPISPGFLSIMLALAAGAGVYVSASILIPESHHTHSQAPTLAMTVASSMIVYGLVQMT